MLRSAGSRGAPSRSLNEGLSARRPARFGQEAPGREPDQPSSRPTSSSTPSSSSAASGRVFWKSSGRSNSGPSLSRFQTPLQSCLARNALRPEDEVVSEQAIRNVFAALEPPSAEEGFEDVLIVP